MGKWPRELSEIFSEIFAHLVMMQFYLITDRIDKEFMETNAKYYADALFEERDGLEMVAECIDVTVLGISRPKGPLPQLVAYNVRSIKHP